MAGSIGAGAGSDFGVEVVDGDVAGGAVVEVVVDEVSGEAVVVGAGSVDVTVVVDASSDEMQALTPMAARASTAAHVPRRIGPRIALVRSTITAPGTEPPRITPSPTSGRTVLWHTSALPAVHRLAPELVG
jgi:hypothetical protein